MDETGWKVDERGRRYRRVGKNAIEYETMVRVDGVEIPQSELAAFNARRAATKTLEVVQDKPALRCPFAGGIAGDCDARCALLTDNGCALAALVDREATAPTAGRKCPFNPYHCTERCALYKNGCILTAF